MTRARCEAGAGLKVRWRRIFWLINCVGWFASDQGCARSLMVKKHKNLTEFTIDYPVEEEANNAMKCKVTRKRYSKGQEEEGWVGGSSSWRGGFRRWGDKKKYNNNKQTINNQSVKETNRGQIRGREEEGFGGWEDHHHHHQEEGLGGGGTKKYNNNNKQTINNQSGIIIITKRKV